MSEVNIWAFDRKKRLQKKVQFFLSVFDLKTIYSLKPSGRKLHRKEEFPVICDFNYHVLPVCFTFFTIVFFKTNVIQLLIYFCTNCNTFLQKSRPRKDSLFQNSSLLESESSLSWTVLWVFRCRYRPAQLSIAHMAHQLEEAEVQYITLLHWFLQNLQL